MPRGVPSRTPTPATKVASVSKTTRDDQKSRRSRARTASTRARRPSTKPKRGKRSELKIKIKEIK